MRIDLDQARAARREALGDAPTILFKGQEFALDIELPFALAERLAELDPNSTDSQSQASAAKAVMQLLLGDQHEGFMALNPSVQDVTVLVEGLMQAYGTGSLSESLASADSS